MIWFTSDWHIGHKNILKYDDRPWETVEEMNEGILNIFNARVHPNDAVYYLGDFAFNIEQGIDILNRVNGRWTYIIGNHDKNFKRILEKSNKQNMPTYKMVEIKAERQEITLCHYPMISWNRSHYGTWQLFGHHHKKTFEDIPGKRLNVALSLHEYKPWSFDEVAEYMRFREMVGVDNDN